MALAGSNQLATIPLDPDSLQAATGPRAVNYTYNPGQSASIVDIVLGPGIQ